MFIRQRGPPRSADRSGFSQHPATNSARMVQRAERAGSAPPDQGGIADLSGSGSEVRWKTSGYLAGRRDGSATAIVRLLVVHLTRSVRGARQPLAEPTEHLFGQIATHSRRKLANSVSACKLVFNNR